MIYNFQLLDCTLREGLQSVDPVRGDRGVVFTEQQSTEIVQMLLDFKIDYLEFGSPIQSKNTFNLIETSLQMAADTDTKINVHCRLHETDLKAALPLAPHGFNFYFNLSRSADASLSKKVVNKVIHFSDRIKRANPKATVRFSFENSFKTKYAVIAHVTKAIYDHVDRIGLPDTTGGAKPSLVRRRLMQFRRDFPDLPIELHFHNDFGLAAANAYEAMHVKNTIIHTSILGLGERNGIVATSQAIALAMMSPSSAKKVQANYDVAKLAKMDEYVAQLLQTSVPHSLPITSSGYFCHSAGVHVHGHSLNKHRYQLLDPQLFAKQTKYCWSSAVVGKANIQARASELGMPIQAQDAHVIAAQVREYAKKHGGVSPQYVDKKIKQISLQKTK